MKLDGVYLIQIMFLLSLITYMYMSYHYYGYEKEKRLYLIVNNIMQRFRIDFSRKLIIEDYVTFEKIGVWRYSSRY